MSGDNARARTASRGGMKATQRVAVLPLANFSPDPKDEYFTDGLTEELISTLSRIAGLRVIARPSVMRYKGLTKPIAEIGKELNAGTILTGSVRISSGKIRIAVQLIEAASEEHLWAQEYDRDLEDIFAVQRDIANRVAKSLKVRILRRETRGIEMRATEKLEAYSLYLRGRQALNTRTEEGLRSAIVRFEQALDQDPSFALAYTGLADAHAILALLEILPPHEAFPKARAAAENAIALDDGLAEAHASLGLVKFQYEWDWPAAEREFNRALDLNRNYAPAHHFHADYLKAMGRFDEALDEMNRAHELDPLSLAINTGLGHVLYLTRQYDRAIEQYQAAVQLDPTFAPARLWFGRPYLQKGMYAEAISELEQAVALTGRSTMSLAVLGHACASAGQEDRALELLETLKARADQSYVPSYWIALIYIGLGVKDEAFVWLERAFRERSSWLVWMGVEPRFDSLRSDPRFASLTARMRLPNPREEETRSLLVGLDSLALSRFRVAGDYVRFDERARNLLKDFRQKVVTGLKTSTPTRENFLVWAPPGGGKTFFVKQLAVQMGPSVRLCETDVASMEEERFRSRLSELDQADRTWLCLVDEADSRPGETWPYEALLSRMDAKPRPGQRGLFILAGSSGDSLAGMKKVIVARPKGTDILSRIPHGNELEIPALTAGDRILVTVATLRQAANAIGRDLTEVEKLALYYIALNNELDSARRLREFALRALGRMPAGEERLKFDHCFEPGDPLSKEFWVQVRSSSAKLINSFVMIQD